MKRRAIILLLLLTVGFFAACKKTPPDLHLMNNSGTALSTIYITNTNEWGPYLNYRPLADGTAFETTLESLGGPGIYSIGTVTTYDRTYTFFDIDLASGDTLDIGPEYVMNEMSLVPLTVTHADWTTTKYTGIAFYGWEVEEDVAKWGTWQGNG